MNTPRLSEILELVTTKEKELLGIKAGEYGKDDERLYNFIRGGDLMECQSYQVAWAYLTKHLVAIQKAVNTGTFNFTWAVKQDDGTYTEGLIQKIVDARNYLFLLLCCIEEEFGTEVKVGMDE